MQNERILTASVVFFCKIENEKMLVKKWWGRRIGVYKIVKQQKFRK